MIEKNTSYFINQQKRSLLTSFFHLLILTVLLQQTVFAASPLVKLFFDSRSNLQPIEPVGESQNTFRVQAIDTNGTPIEKAMIKWELSNTNITIESVSEVTDQNGFSSVKLNIPPETTGNLTALLDGQRKTFNLISNKKYRFNGQLISSHNNIEANGYDFVTVSTQLIGSTNQRPVAGAAVDWRLEDNNAEAILSADNSVSFENGTASIKVRANKEGTVNVVAVINKNNSTTAAEIKQRIPLSFKKGYFLGLQRLDIKNQTFNDNLYIKTVKAIVKNADEVAIPNREVFWQLRDDQNLGAMLRNSRKVTDQKGENPIEITSPKPGKVDIIATIYSADANKLHQLERRSATITFEPTFTIKPLTVVNNMAEANGSDAITITTQLVNEKGAGYSQADVRWRLEQNSANAFLSNKTTTTNLQGETDIKLHASQAGTVIVQAIAADDIEQRLLKSKKVTFQKSYNVGFKSLTVDKSVAKGNGIDAIIATALIVNTNGEPLQNNPSVFWVKENDSIGAQISLDENTGNKNGQVSARITAKMEGSVTLKATVININKPQQQESLRVEVFFKNNASIAELAASPIVTANGNDRITVTTKIVNDKKEPLQGQPIIWSLEAIDDIDAQFVELADNKITKTNQQGTTSAELIAFKPGKVNVVATIVGQPRGQSDLIKQKRVQIRFLRSPAILTLIPTETGQIEANGEENIAITAHYQGTQQPEDAINQKIQWRIVKNQTDVQLTGVDKDGINRTNTQGKATIKLKSTKAGMMKVKASLVIDGDNAHQAETSDLAITFRKNPKQLSITTEPETPLVGEQVTATLTAKATDGTPLRNAVVQWTKTGVGSPVETTETTITNEHGITSKKYQSTTTGSLTVTAHIRGINATETVPVRSKPIEFQNYDLVSLMPASNDIHHPIGSKALIFTGTINSISQFDNTVRPVAGKRIKLKWLNEQAGTQPTITLSNNGVSDKNGKITITASADKPITNTLTVTAEHPEKYPKPLGKESFEKKLTFFNPSPAAKIDFEIDEITKSTNYWRLADNEEKVTVTLTATDDSGAPVQGANVKWTNKGRAGTLSNSSPNNVTDANGKAWAEFKSDGISGILELEATVSNSMNEQAQKTEALAQKIEFQGYKMTIDKQKIGLNTGDEGLIVITIKGIVEDKTTKHPDRLIKNKTISYQWSQNPPINVAYSGSSKSNENGQIILKVSSKVNNFGLLTLMLDGKGAINSESEQIVNIGFYNYALTDLTQTNTYFEANNSETRIPLTARITMKKNDKRAIESRLDGRAIEWSLEQEPHTGAAIRLTDASTNADGAMTVSLTARRWGVVKVTAAIKHQGIVISEKTTSIHFKQTSDSLELDSSITPNKPEDKFCSLLFKDEFKPSHFAFTLKDINGHGIPAFPINFRIYSYNPDGQNASQKTYEMIKESSILTNDSGQVTGPSYEHTDKNSNPYINHMVAIPEFTQSQKSTFLSTYIVYNNKERAKGTSKELAICDLVKDKDKKKVPNLPVLNKIEEW